MIEKTKSFKTSDGRIFGTIEEAQKCELCIIISQIPLEKRQDINIADVMLEKREAIVNILTTKGSSHPAARKANGATRKPRKTPAATEGAAA